MSNYYCHPGKAGGLPILFTAAETDELKRRVSRLTAEAERRASEYGEVTNRLRASLADNEARKVELAEADAVETVLSESEV